MGSDRREDELREKARSVLGSWRQAREPMQPPFYVEFAGMPKSGKSCCIDIVSHFFRRVGFKVHAPAEGASKRTPYYLKQDLVAFNAWCASYALTHILEGVYGSDRFDLAILDRGLFDSLAWFELLTSQGSMTTGDRDAVSSFLLLDHWRKHIDVVFLFKADAETSLRREYEHKLIDEPGLAMNAGFLTQLNEAYEAVQTKFGGKMPAVSVVDTSDAKGTTQKSTAHQVALQIIGLMTRGTTG